MIDLKELRIGNLVSLNGRYIDVESISSAVINITGEDEEFGGFIGDSWRDIEPIPLTPELLEKCGFIEKGHVNEDQDDVEWMQHPNLQDLKYRNGYVKLEYLELPHIQYLHQLQNLYFSITREELQINL